MKERARGTSSTPDNVPSSRRCGILPKERSSTRDFPRDGGSRKDAGQAVGQVGDGGIDGIIKEDKLGLDAIYLQAKRWEGTVGGPVVQGFVGALIGKKARKGVFITTSNFSQQAQNYANGIENLKIILIDGEQLAQLMIDHDVGVTEESRYIVKKVDLDYFGDE